MRTVDENSETFTRIARRRQIVDAAIDVIAEVGWAQTSIRKVADRVGVAMSAVQYHFGTKEGLVEAIVEETIRSAVSAVGPAVSAEITATGRLAAYIRAGVAFYNDHRRLLAAVTHIENEFRPGSRAATDKSKIDPALHDGVEVLDPTSLLVEGRKSGEFGEFAIPAAAIALRAAVRATVENILRDPQFDAVGYGEDLIALFNRAVGVKD